MLILSPKVVVADALGTPLAVTTAVYANTVVLELGLDDYNRTNKCKSLRRQPSNLSKAAI